MTFAAVLLCASGAVMVTVDRSASPKPVAPTFQGIFLEDVSHAADVLMTEKGFREEAVSLLAALKPGFVRFPGGCAAQGRTFEEQFDWKRTICPPEDRPCVSNLWGYVTNFRLGFYEYFLLCEKLGAEPVPVVAAGMTCHHFSKSQHLKAMGSEMDAVARDACDLVEFANGDMATVWGRKRAEMGHPLPFGLKYLSIGNEDVGTNYLVRYRAMAKVLRKRHPEIRLVAAAHRAMERDQGYPAARTFLTAEIADVLDEHFYFSRDWLRTDGRRFDGYPRTQKLAVTEYAHKERGWENTESSALQDIAFLLVLLRNADLVEMTSYAPTFAWTGRENWRPNLVGFDGTHFLLSPNYVLQSRFAEDRPDEVLPATVSDGDADFVAVVGRRDGCLQVQCVNLSDMARGLTVDTGTGVRTFSLPAQSYQCFSLEKRIVDSFNDGWEVRREGETAWTGVTVPHDAAFDRGYDREEDWDQGFVRCPKTVYRKTFARPVGPGRYSVRFDGVYMNSTVSLNGRTVGGRVNGFLPFEVALDGLAETNVIEVICDAATPNARWYVGCGILRNVWLVRREGAFTLEPEAVSVTTDLLPDGSARVRVKADGARVVEPENGELIVREPKLWTPETPNLLYLDVTAENAAGKRDTVRIRYGIRTIEFTKDRGMLLNGKPYRIKGLCRHETFGALGGAFNLAATKRELAMCKEMGANAIRTAHNPFSPEFYDLCDEMGFLVKDEAFDEWRIPKTKNGSSRFFDANWNTDLADFIRRDRNHPCVILWSVGNEICDHWQGSEGAELARQMVDVVHALDRSRPVTAGLNNPGVSYTNGVLHALDVVGLNYNADWYAKLKGEKPVFGSETAPSLADRDVYLFEEKNGALLPIQASNHLECAYSPKAFTWAAPAEVALKAQLDSPWSAGEFAWCTYDYLGEPNHTGHFRRGYWPARSSYWGLCDLAGMRKDRFHLYKSQWSDRPVAHLMPDWTLPGREGKIVPVWCYTNAEEAELFLNGVSQGVRRFSETEDLHLAWDVPYFPGTLEVRAKMRDGRIVTDRRLTAGAVADYRVTRDFAADGLVFFRIDAVDANGTRVIACEDELAVSVRDGELLALDNGSPLDHTPFSAASRRLCRGSLVAIVRGSRSDLPDVRVHRVQSVLR